MSLGKARKIPAWWDGGKTYNLERVGDNADSHQLLAVVAAVHHERVGQSLNDGAVGLAESLDGISASGVGDIDGVSQGNVVTIRRASISISIPPNGFSKQQFLPCFRQKGIFQNFRATYVREMSRTSTS